MERLVYTGGSSFNAKIFSNSSPLCEMLHKYPIYLRMDLDLGCTLQTKPTSQCRLWATICVIKLRIHGQYSSRNGHAMVIKSLRYRREENIARLLIMPSRQQRKFPPNRWTVQDIELSATIAARQFFYCNDFITIPLQSREEDCSSIMLRTVALRNWQ